MSSLVDRTRRRARPQHRGVPLGQARDVLARRLLPHRPTAVQRIERQGELALNQGLVLTPGTFVRGSHPVEVTGADAVRASSAWPPDAA